MEIKINFDDWFIDAILKHYKYKREKVLLWRPDLNGELINFHAEIAYKEGERPAELDKEKPLYFNLLNYTLTNVFDRLYQHFLVTLFPLVQQR